MATVVTGQGTTTNVNSSQLAIDIGKEIKLLEPEVQALTVFSREVRSEATVATKFKWMEDERKQRFDTVSAAVASTSTQEIPVTHGTYFQQWDHVLNTRTGELFRIDSVSGNTANVTRGIGSVAAAMNENDELYLIGTAQPEGDRSKAARSLVPTTFENYTQISRTPFELSDTAANVGYQVQPREWDRKQKNAGIEHAIDIEETALFNRKSATNPGSTETRTTGGILSFISSNQTDAGGILSEAEFGAFLATVLRYGSKDKIAFCSATALQALNKFPASKQVTQNDETTYGMDVTTYRGPFGSIKTVWHKLLEGNKYGGYMIVVDMQNIAWRPLTNRDTKLLQNRQENDADGKKAEFLTEAGLEFGLQRTHGVLSGITG